MFFFSGKITCEQSGNETTGDGSDGVVETCEARRTIAYVLNVCHTLWLFNIAMDNGPFIGGLPIKNGDFPRLC